MEIRRFKNIEECSGAAAWFIVEAGHDFINRQGFFTLALSGGRSPRKLYEALAQPLFSERIPWKRVHFFWTDERCVTPDHAHSNFRLAMDTFLSVVPIPEENIHRMPGEVVPPEEAAAEYEKTLKDFFGCGPDQPFPGFDLALLGLGQDGHTASLFPESEALFEAKRWVVQTPPPPGVEPAVSRLTLTIPALNASKNVIFLVSGPDKEAVVKKVFENPPVAARDYPAARIQPRGKLTWFLDESNELI